MAQGSETLERPTRSSTSTAPRPVYPPPNLLKGALVQVDRKSSKTSTVPFQYNPEKLTRVVTPSYERDSFTRFTGVASESITLTVRLEASTPEEAEGGYGILGRLAALELMVNPSSKDLQQVLEKASGQKLEAVAAEAPRLLFVWGPKRVLPVALESVTVTETLFNDYLSPVLADVELKLRLYSLQEAFEEKNQQLLVGRIQEMERLRDAAQKRDKGVSTGVEVGAGGTVKSSL